MAPPTGCLQPCFVKAGAGKPVIPHLRPTGIFPGSRLRRITGQSQHSGYQRRKDPIHRQEEDARPGNPDATVELDFCV
jgi:hypothetical protein